MNFEIGDKVNFICAGVLYEGNVLDVGTKAILVEHANGDRKGYEVWVRESELALVKLPVVPRYVAEWIIESKEVGRTLIRAIKAENKHMPRLMVRWLLDNADNQVLFARAWSGKYEVEDEPLYYVRLPLAYWDEDKAELEDIYRYLRLNVTSEETEISGRTTVSEWQKADGWRTQLTEKQIKDIDEAYWAFRVPVEEVEETE
ncbi:DUF1642 domain-containing protein [Listeria monocytogenes]|uniref:DUF1642 domain-containing protein n=1 Tax=Listeria monocytogenes TaxID=1639 RepID=UPI001765A17B|nr:DUF1642 domain-containing protein [Listeria monocytogenes]EJE1215415.1 DUF1642 domain-containing protein [Listeria monocytogenes]EJE1224393.1 DUF1642 domain-containing protein [Listeria monocytogenes]EJE1228104.1 DUF1642 domain-containing protein [Listeria monocytogenes]EJE1344537.1 DUF1642 domain-containing protein [Listeria monocytogenes]EJE2774734.1 DUF1642 domain-containing protein [Listeria monocytogenes]